MTRAMTGLLVAVLGLLAPADAFALIIGGVGNEPVPDPGWPQGADAIFNHVGRVAWWEGPPLGGGQWHAECRGDAKALSAVLANFAKLDVKTKRVVVHDGLGHSFWLAPNREPEKAAESRIDWVFMVWQSTAWKRWKQIRNPRADFDPTDPDGDAPPSQIDVYTADIRWDDVVVPAGIEVLDERLEAHGFTAADGIVIQGRVKDLATGQPIAATARLQRVDQRSRGRLYPDLAKSKTDAQGRWVMKNAPAGWVRVVVESDGFAPRVAGYAQFEEQPQWKSFDTELTRFAHVSGRVTDDSGMGLADVEVNFRDVQTDRGRYESLSDPKVNTDAEGRFRADLPAGKATVWLHKPGYCRPGLGLAITTPKDDVALQMVRSGGIRVTVDFAGNARPKGYLVQIEPEGGAMVGLYGGSGNIDQNHQMTFENVPPGRYVLIGQPNPSSAGQATESVTIDLKGGEAREVTLKAK